MFTIYKKLITPESSPILGPITPRESTPRESPNIVPVPMKETPLIKKGSPQMEPFSLYDCCCSPRNKQPDQNQSLQPVQKQQNQPPLQNSETEYEFGHATHYKYNKRLVSAP